MPAVFEDTSGWGETGPGHTRDRAGADAEGLSVGTDTEGVSLAEFRTWIRRATAEERAHVIEQCHALTVAAQQVMLETIAAADEAGDCESDGAPDPAPWLLARLNLHPRTARLWVEVAAGLRDLPAISEALGAGLLTLDQVRVLTRFVTAQTDTDWAERAQTMPVWRLEHEARRHRPPTVDDAHRTWERRRLRMWWNDPEHVWEGDFTLPDTLGATLHRALTRLARKAPPNPDTEQRDPWQACLADALVSLAAHAIGTDPDPDRATIVVHAPYETLTGAGTDPAELPEGPLLANETLQRLVCDARIQGVFTDDEGNPIAYTHVTRRIPPKLARLLHHRDRHCRFPGCTRRTWIQFHHLTPVSRGGHTHLAGLVTLCNYHHWHVHEGHWTITGNPNTDLTFTNPAGNRLTTRPPPVHPTIAHWTQHKLFG